MNFDQLMEKILEAFPNAIVDEKDGEIVISTGLTLLGDHETVADVSEENTPLKG